MLITLTVRVYILAKKILKLNTIKKILLKCDVINGSVLNGVRQPIIVSAVLDKPSGYSFFCEHETIHYKNQINLF